MNSKAKMFQMCLYFLVVTFPPIQLIGQPDGKTYSNFIAEERKIYWNYVYERLGIEKDSLRHSIYREVLTDNSFQIVDNGQESLIVEMKEMIFEMDGHRVNGRVIFAFKDGKYRVSVSDVRYFLGHKAMRKNRDISFLLGVPETQNANQVGLRMEDAYLNKKGEFIKSGHKYLDHWNDLFKQKFDFQLASSKEKADW